MAASKFEFEQRFWIIGFIFFIGFGLSQVDHTNFAQAVLQFVAPSIDPDGAQGTRLLQWMFGAGAVLVFLAALLRTWATAYLRTEVVHDAKQHSETLLADGPYRYVRNPLYLANLPMAAGVGMLASRVGWFFMVFGMLLLMYRLILREEAGLLQTQGESYRAYLRSVPRLWPALIARVPSAGGQPRWGQAFAAEMFIWLFGVAVLSFAVTLDFKLTCIMFASSLLVYFVAVWAVKKRAAA